MPPAASDWNAAAYHRVSEPQFAWGVAVLERLALRGDETVLDAGCGSGRLTAELLRRLPRGRVVALDRSAAMARRTRETLGAAAHAVVVQGDLLHLPLRAAVDVVFSNATFHWVLDHDRLFAEVRAALRPGGRLLAQCGGGENLARVHAVAARLMDEPDFGARFAGWEEPWHFAHEEETWRRLEAAGFTDVRVALVEAPTAFATRAELREFLATVVLRPHLARLESDPALHERFLESVTDTLAAEAPRLTLDYWRLNIEGRAAAP
jgi:trans-aconitate 2-methyltransferase